MRQSDEVRFHLGHESYDPWDDPLAQLKKNPEYVASERRRKELFAKFLGVCQVAGLMTLVLLALAFVTEVLNQIVKLFHWLFQ